MQDGRLLHFLLACFVHIGAWPLNELPPPPPPLLHHLTERPWIQHFHPPALLSSPKMQWRSSAVVGVKLCINSLNVLRHWFNISAQALEVLTPSWTWIVLLWTEVLWSWVISCLFASVTSGILAPPPQTKKEKRKEKVSFLQHKKFPACLKFVFTVEEAGLCFSLPPLT